MEKITPKVLRGVSGIVLGVGTAAQMGDSAGPSSHVKLKFKPN
jgi:hypothetical protein